MVSGKRTRRDNPHFAKHKGDNRKLEYNRGYHSCNYVK